LLCWPREECDQGQILYHRFLKSGGNIKELNIVRKHISLLKGGGLAKELYPATVVGLIFSDVPGDEYDMIASGPTYKDVSTMSDARKIIEKYNLGTFNLNETPKDDEYFNNVHNIPLVSNQLALEAMKTKAEELGFAAKILAADIYEGPKQALEKLTGAATANSAILAGGEIQLVVNTADGSGGRNLHLAMQALKIIGPNDTFIALASDGLDNSEAAGAIVDNQTIKKIKDQNLDVNDYIKRFDGLNLFKKIDEVLYTGPTEANVSDLMILLRK
jgi:glycerate-2-kinase